MGKLKAPPIPREEPEDDEAWVPEGPTTVRPPPPGAGGAGGAGNAPVATYQKLRESCRVQPIADADQARLDEELAIEAEILRVAMDRKRGRSRPPG